MERSLVRATVRRAGVEPPYFTREDEAVVSGYLEQLARDAGPVAVQFVPDGEGLLFERLRSPRLRFVQQTFYIGGFDVAVIHDSIWCPRYVHDLELLNVLGLHAGEPNSTRVIRARDGTEKWTVIQWQHASPSREAPPL